MTKIFCAASALGFILILTAASQADVTASEVNGTWRNGKNEFKIWALGQQKLKIEFSGVYEYQNAYGPNANVGEGSGIAHIDADTAIFKPDGAEDECKITLRFGHGKLLANQNGICGFGFNVTAAGTYKKVSSPARTAARRTLTAAGLSLGFE